MGGVRTNMRTIGVGKSLYCMGGLNHHIVKLGLEEKIDNFVKACKKKNLGDCSSHTTNEGVAVIAESAIYPTDEVFKDSSHHNDTFEGNIEAASRYCNGFAVPLQVESGLILAAALIAHGGEIRSRASSAKGRKGGTKIPIFLSIGHKMSLQEAIKICVAVSYARIPESVRKADLIGRQI